MPLYEYQCLNCGKKTEVIQRFDDAPLAAIRRALTSPDSAKPAQTGAHGT